MTQFGPQTRGAAIAKSAKGALPINFAPRLWCGLWAVWALPFMIYWSPAVLWLGSLERATQETCSVYALSIVGFLWHIPY